MLEKRNEKRLVRIGTLISFGVGVIIGYIARNPLLAIASGVILAIIVQRLIKTPEEREDNSNEDNPS